MARRPAGLAIDPPDPPSPRLVVVVCGAGGSKVEGVREEWEELIPVGNEPVVDNEDGREDESGGNDPVKLEVGE